MRTIWLFVVESGQGANAWRTVDGVMADNDIKEISREYSNVMRNSGRPLRSGNCGTDRETTTEAAGLRKQQGQADCGNEEGG